GRAAARSRDPAARRAAAVEPGVAGRAAAPRPAAPRRPGRPSRRPRARSRRRARPARAPRPGDLRGLGSLRVAHHRRRHPADPTPDRGAARMQLAMSASEAIIADFAPGWASAAMIVAIALAASLLTVRIGAAPA